MEKDLEISQIMNTSFMSVREPNNTSNRNILDLD